MTQSAGFAAHLGIPLDEYDARIRTFVPYYEEMLEQVARTVRLLRTDAPIIVDLGTGTGALAERCLRAVPDASVIGVDGDPGMLTMAGERLAGDGRVELRHARFDGVDLPRCDLVVASISLHHIADPDAKRALYRSCRAALDPDGAMVIADCYLPASRTLAAEGMARWRQHLERTFRPEEAAGYLDAWAEEDTYFRLDRELSWFAEAAFRPDVIWRRDLFAVLLCTAGPSISRIA